MKNKKPLGTNSVDLPDYFNQTTVKKGQMISYDLERTASHTTAQGQSTALNSSLEERRKSYDSAGSHGENSVNQIYLSAEKQLLEFQPKKMECILGSYLIADITRKLMVSLAKQGDLMIPKNQFNEKLREEMLEFKISLTDEILNSLKVNKVIHITTRKFGEWGNFDYVSMFLDEISIESLDWCLRSLRKDRMTPREKLVYSRLKECFGVNLSNQDWRGHLKYLLAQSKKSEKAFERRVHINFKKSNLSFLLSIEKEPEKNSDILVIYPDGKEYIIDDTKEFDENDQKLWKEFLEFFDRFFESSQSSDYSSRRNSPSTSSNNWTSSVENIFTKELSKKPPYSPHKSISKIIPGGKYGAAQFVKCCGPERLKCLSLGKLSIFVQEAISRNVLIYKKTNLMKAENINIKKEILIDLTKGTFSRESVRLNPGKQEKLKQVQRIILNILSANKEGVTLSKLPKLINEALHFKLDLQELGFSKLKQLLGKNI